MLQTGSPGSVYDASGLFRSSCFSNVAKSDVNIHIFIAGFSHAQCNIVGVCLIFVDTGAKTVLSPSRNF